MKNIEEFISEGSDVFDDKTRSLLSHANNIVKDAKNIDEVETKLKDLFKDSDKEELKVLLLHNPIFPVVCEFYDLVI